METEREAAATRLVAAYDAERPTECLAACKTIVAVHEQLDVPGTIFLLGRLLVEEPDGAEYRALLRDHPLFEIASHSFSHRMMREHPFCGPVMSPEQRTDDLRKGKDAVEQAFGTPCRGLRPACGFDGGLHGDAAAVAEVAGAGFEYVSSRLWGPGYTLPVPPLPPETYAAEGFPDLVELPGHGWHENVLKGHFQHGQQFRILWPPVNRKLMPSRPVRTVAAEATVHWHCIEHAQDEGVPYVSLVWHPWSLAQRDPAMRMVERIFRQARGVGLLFATYAQERQRLRSGRPNAST